MSHFLVLEKERQAAFKQRSDTFSPAAHADGRFGQHDYPFCVPEEYAEENLLPGIRQTATEYFRECEIKLAPRSRSPARRPHVRLTGLLRQLSFPLCGPPCRARGASATDFSPSSADAAHGRGLFVAHEWIGAAQTILARRYRAMASARVGPTAPAPTRRCASAAWMAALRWCSSSGSTLSLYSSTDLSIAPSGTDPKGDLPPAGWIAPTAPLTARRSPTSALSSTSRLPTDAASSFWPRDGAQSGAPTPT